jgi:hypothetical protein
MERLVETSNSDGVDIEFGGHMSLIFRDPDGFMAEALVPKREPWTPRFRSRLSSG